MKIIRDTALGVAPATRDEVRADPWKLLVVDDEADVRNLTLLTLRNMSFAGRPIHFIEAASAAEAIQRLQDNDDVAIALIDVVMESEDAGLKLVETIRGEMNNLMIRLVIRTGQPGLAPERSIIDHYDIDDYKDKTELTATRLYTTIRSALKAYRDLLLLKTAEQALHEQTLSLIRAKDDLTRFAEISAHHLMEPIRRQATYVQRLRFDLSGLPGAIENPEVRFAIDTLTNDAHHLGDLMRDIKRYLAAGEPHGKTTSQDAGDVLQAVLRQLTNIIATSRAVIDVGPLPNAVIDRTRFAQLFAVIIENALVHGRPVGSSQLPRIGITGKRDGRMSRYRVADNGPGIPPQHLERVFRIFERFGSAADYDGRLAGTGAGLSIARRIVDSRDGRIWIESPPDEGTTVVFELPDGQQDEST